MADSQLEDKGRWGMEMIMAMALVWCFSRLLPGLPFLLPRPAQGVEAWTSRGRFCASARFLVRTTESCARKMIGACVLERVDNRFCLSLFWGANVKGREQNIFIEESLALSLVICFA